MLIFMLRTFVKIKGLTKGRPLYFRRGFIIHSLQYEMHLRIIIVSEAFCEGVVVDLELCDLQLNKHQEFRSSTNAEVAAGSCG